MLWINKSTTQLWVYPPQHNQSKRSLRNQNGTIFFKPSSRTPFVSFNFDISCTTINTSVSLNQTLDHKNTDHNSQICKFCEVGNLKMAMDLLCKSQTSELDSKTYCLILQLCADMKSLNHGRKVHSLISSNGVEIEGALGAKLVFMYVTCGDLVEGRRVFDKVANEKVFLWNLLMNEYAKFGNFRESLFLYKRMQELGVEANSYTFSCVLKCFAALGSVEEGEKVHGYLLRLGFGSYNTVVNSLIAFYFKCRRIESARKLFDELGDRDVISWNSMISGYVANGLPEKGVEIFKEMLSLGISVDLATMVSVLAACVNLGTLLLGRALHTHGIKGGFNKKIMFNNTLLDMYAKCGDMDGAIRVFENMEERSVVSWTSVIAGYVRGGLSEKAIEIFCEMKREGIDPDIFTITSILHACACSGSLENGKEVHDYIRENNLQSNRFISNALMDMYAKCGSMEDALSVFSQMPAKDIVSWNTMIGGYSKNSLPNEALDLFVKMNHELKPDNVTMTCILPACASLAALDRGRVIHGYIMRNGLSSDRYVANALIDMYVKCGVLVLAQLLFDMIPLKDLVLWTVMIAGYGMHGFGSEAIATFNKMRHAGIEPDEVSFISILYACSHSGLLDEGWRFFNIMKNDCNIEPKLEHYACMVDLLARAGKLPKAYTFIIKMPIKPDATIWGALLRGCRIYHDVKLAERVAEHVFELEPENTGYYVLLANIYAEAEKWEEVKKLRQRIGWHGLRKNPGCSWIEIKGKVHIFVARDNSHPQAKKIVSLLKETRMKMKEEGYSPKMRYALIDADDVEKEVALCGHSEKLAMGFGILNLPPGKTVRVTKNLRVCGDCHEMAKFMSKMFEREIILRDSNRFHHFKDGHCSCRGFW
ncbi:pentatricopeptide repeat-containing protein DOT4, chloroplastic [Cornus florida]|uniref:pentatricopeptide repeat-containing protein DOT4, chloroplastic n=1 Tax=Cornus florida TaxID=4283 RepID=UPI002896E3DC|nr:pentatricopeptide repeat-containing protein DOT4, chloroplastic [Cornus florida]XP_059664331.1 pentatricopeptide repeat-containing protein DOT4, chloroplastic [Cornus florida]